VGGWKIGAELFEAVKALGADPAPALILGDSLEQ